MARDGRPAGRVARGLKMDSELLQPYLVEHDRFMTTATSLPWLNEIQHAGRGRFAAQQFPTPAREEWKYTDVTPLLQQHYTLAEGVIPELSRSRLEALAVATAPRQRLVFVNGRYSATHSDIRDLPPPVILTSLQRQLTLDPQPLQQPLSGFSASEENGFLALNSAYLDQGVYLNIPNGVSLDEPILLLFVSAPDETHRATMSQLRNLVRIGAHCRVSLILQQCGLSDQPLFNNQVTQIDIGRAAELRFYHLQEETAGTLQISNTRVRQAASSRLRCLDLGLGGRLARHDLQIELQEPEARCDLGGLYLVDGHQHLDHHVRIDHARPAGVSRARYKGILEGRGRAVFNGRVLVHADAQKSDARLTNSNLLLSARAEVDTKPQLEIFADDVKCSHGTTVGQLDDTALHYLRSRGIDPVTARNLLIYGFAADILDRIDNPAVRDHLRTRLLGRLAAGEALQEWL